MNRKTVCFLVLLVAAPCAAAQQWNDQDPSISPDGYFILFRSDRSGNSDIFKMRTDGGQAVRLTDAEGWDGDAGWVDGGKAILYATSADGARTFYRMKPNGSERRRTEWPGLESTPHQAAEAPSSGAAAAVVGSPTTTRSVDPAGDSLRVRVIVRREEAAP